MKKYIGILVAFAVVCSLLAFTGCSDKTDKTPANQDASVTDNAISNDNTSTEYATREDATHAKITLEAGQEPEAYITAEPQAVAAGENIEIEYCLRNVNKATAFDLSFEYDTSLLTYVKSKAKNEIDDETGTQDEDTQIFANCTEAAGQIVYSGCVMYSITFADEEVFEAEFTVNKDVPSGTQITVTPVVTSFQLAEDTEGSKIVGDVSDQVKLTPFTITVK